MPPVKIMQYDAEEYDNQLKEIQKNNDKKFKKGSLKGRGSGEFVEKYLKDDKLKPVITMGIYWGSEEWDGPLTLREMLDASDERILKSVPDYRPNILIPSRMTDRKISEYSNGLDIAFALAKASKKKMKWTRYLKE